MKQWPTVDSRGKNADRNAAKGKAKKKGITFDEKNVTETYHPAEKDYGFMKIDEPNTPGPRVEGPVSARDLRNRLEKLREMQLASSVSMLPEEQAAQRKRNFEEKRKAIYSGEFVQAKEALKKVDDLTMERKVIQQPPPNPKFAPSQPNKNVKK